MLKTINNNEQKKKCRSHLDHTEQAAYDQSYGSQRLSGLAPNVTEAAAAVTDVLLQTAVVASVAAFVRRTRPRRRPRHPRLGRLWRLRRRAGLRGRNRNDVVRDTTSTMVILNDRGSRSRHDSVRPSSYGFGGAGPGPAPAMTSFPLGRVVRLAIVSPTGLAENGFRCPVGA